MVKKICFYFIAALFMVSIPAQSHSRDDFKKWVKYKLTQHCNDSELQFSDNCVDVNFAPVHYNNGYYFIGVTVRNKTGNRISIEWNNARINGSKAKVNNGWDNNFSDEKGDELVISGEKSEYRCIIPKDNVLSDKMYPLYDDDDKENRDIPIIIPIRYNGSTVDYKFNIQFSKYSETEIDSMYAEQVKYHGLSKLIKKNMTIDQVCQIMGECNDKTYFTESNGQKKYTSLIYPNVEIILNKKSLVKRIDIF